MAVIFRNKRYGDYREIVDELFEKCETIDMVDERYHGWEIAKKGSTLQLIQYDGIAPMEWSGPYRGTCPLRKKIIAEKEVA